jgi:hypothetical protein
MCRKCERQILERYRQRYLKYFHVPIWLVRVQKLASMAQ